MTDQNEAVRVGVVGLGGMGTTHARIMNELGASIAAGTDVQPDARDSFAEEYGARGYADHDSMLAEEALDAVVVTVPNAFHEPAVTAALEADVPVLVEKPLADSLEAAERIAAAEAASDAFGMIGLNNTFCPAAEQFVTLDEAGRFGDIAQIETTYLRRRGIPDRESWFTTAELSGGGALIDIGVHALDFALFLLGYPAVERVTGVTRRDFGKRRAYADPDGWTGGKSGDDPTFDVDDSATALITCENGTTIRLDVAWAVNREPTRGVMVRGTDAGAQLSLGGDELAINDAGVETHDHYLDCTYDLRAEQSSKHAQDALFLQRVRRGDPPERNTIEQGLQVQAVLDAIYRSAAEESKSVAV